MDITLAEVLKRPCFKDSEILTAKSALDRSVTAVTVGEVPDIAEWLSGGELVLSTFFATGKDKVAQIEFATAIINSPASGLVFKPDRFVKALPKTILDLAETRDFPVIQVPVWVRWTAVINDVSTMMAMTAAELKLRGGFLEGILSGSLSKDEVLRQAAHLGGDLSAGCYVLVAEIDAQVGAPSQTLESVFETTNQVIKSIHEKSVVVPEPEGAVAFVTVGENAESPRQRLTKTALRLQTLLKGLAQGGLVSVGISSYCADADHLYRAYSEAKQALIIKRRLGERGCIACFEEMDIYRLLMRLAETDASELRGFYDKTLAPLVKYDQKHRTALVKTLETFFANSENINRTANELYTHRHTIRYRLHRAAEITGLNLEQTDDREKIGLAIKTMRLLHF